jgi:hypothetical protein
MNAQAPNQPEDPAGSQVSPPAWMSRLGLGAIGWVLLLLLVIIGGLTVVATVVGIADIVRAGKHIGVRCAPRKKAGNLLQSFGGRKFKRKGPEFRGPPFRNRPCVR